MEVNLRRAMQAVVFIVILLIPGNLHHQNSYFNSSPSTSHIVSSVLMGRSNDPISIKTNQFHPGSYERVDVVSKQSKKFFI